MGIKGVSRGSRAGETIQEVPLKVKGEGGKVKGSGGREGHFPHYTSENQKGL